MRRLSGEDWRAHRDLRLEMLAAAPDAFWTTLDQVRDRSEEQWRADAEGPVIRLHAEVDGQVAGGLGIDPVGYVEEMRLDERTVNIVAVYVRPAFRGGDVTRALFAGAARELAALGRDRLLLEVTDDNLPARRRYESLGFRPTGALHPDPRREDHREIEYGTDLAGLLAHLGATGVPGAQR